MYGLTLDDQHNSSVGFRPRKQKHLSCADIFHVIWLLYTMNEQTGYRRSVTYNRITNYIKTAAIMSDEDLVVQPDAGFPDSFLQ